MTVSIPLTVNRELLMPKAIATPQHSRTTAAVRSGLRIHSIPIQDLKPDPGNPRLHSERHVAQLVTSIETFGFCVPLLIDSDFNVIAGHGRLLAAKKLGWAAVPTISLNHLTAAQAQAYRVADNRLSEVSTWDPKLLGLQLQQLSLADLDFDLTSIGFEMAEIDLHIQNLSLDDHEDEDFASDSSSDEPLVSVLGDMWSLGPHRIVCGNALQPEPFQILLGEARADLVISDMPYNVRIAGHAGGKGKIRHDEFAMASGEMSFAEFTQFLTTAVSQMKQASVEGALYYLFMDWRHLPELFAAGAANGLELKNLCVWDKGSGGMGSLYRSQHELVLVYKHGSSTSHTNNVQLGRFGRNRSNVWSYPGMASFARKTDEGNLLALHPTVKPLAMIVDVILDASRRGDRVLDPFLGSGTLILAAEKTGRVGYGIELDPRYVDTAVRRWQRLTGRQAIHAATGVLFDTLEAERNQMGDASLEQATAGEGA